MCLLLCKCSREKKMFTAKNKRGGYWDWICKRLFVMYYSTSALTFRQDAIKSTVNTRNLMV